MSSARAATEESTECPICSLPFLGDSTAFERHVNGCLDVQPETSIQGAMREAERERSRSPGFAAASTTAGSGRREGTAAEASMSPSGPTLRLRPPLPKLPHPLSHLETAAETQAAFPRVNVEPPPPAATAAAEAVAVAPMEAGQSESELETESDCPVCGHSWPSLLGGDLSVSQLEVAKHAHVEVCLEDVALRADSGSNGMEVDIEGDEELAARLAPEDGLEAGDGEVGVEGVAVHEDSNRLSALLDGEPDVDVDGEESTDEDGKDEAEQQQKRARRAKLGGVTVYADGLESELGRQWQKGSRKWLAREVQGVPAVIPILHYLISKSVTHSTSPTRPKIAYLSHISTQHIRSVAGVQADAGWGCGYRNFQMMMSCVRHLDAYRKHLLELCERATTTGLVKDPTAGRGDLEDEVGEGGEVAAIPTIDDFRGVVEDAWKQGYDPLGADHFGYKLRQSKKWIGTPEVYVMMTRLGIRTRVIDFPKPKSALRFNGSESDLSSIKGDKSSMQKALTRWVLEYYAATPSKQATTANPEQASTSNGTAQKSAFDVLMKSSGESIHYTGKPPLFLQHTGHSRTIVGVEVDTKGEVSLILFDPGKRVAEPIVKAAQAQALASQSSSGVGGEMTTLSSSSSLSVPRPSKLQRLKNRMSGTARAASVDVEEGEPNLAPGMQRDLSAESTDGGSSSRDSKRDAKTSQRELAAAMTGLGEYTKLLEPYRVNVKSLGKKSEYQILCIEEGPPLSLAEKEQRKYLRSTVIGQ